MVATVPILRRECRAGLFSINEAGVPAGWRGTCRDVGMGWRWRERVGTKGLVGREGFEPSTNGLRVRCSTS